MYATYNASPLGRAQPEDPRSFFLKIMGMMTDHANDQMKRRALVKAMKQRVNREVRGERALFRLTTPKLLDAIFALTNERLKPWKRGMCCLLWSVFASTVPFMGSFAHDMDSQMFA